MRALLTSGLVAIAFPIAVCAQAVEFNRDIRPILSDKCFACHGPDASHRKAGLRFDLEPGAHKAIAPGHPEQSPLIRRVTSTSKALRMPPAYAGRDALKPSQIDLLRRWIEQGARWEPFWSFQPPKRPALPAVRDGSWPRNSIDRFILARLDREGLRPSPEAGRATLLRRVSLDLTGLPPTPAETAAYLADTSPGAYEKVVDRLLASPRYAERMAYRWMEAARYGDTNGYQTDGPRQMWRWRDWVLNAFEHNLPYDRFIMEQLAGDLLPAATRDQRIATGFNRNHRTNGEGGIIPEEYRVEYVADRAQTTATVFLGLTLGCARCHDHKYDPLSQKDFYRLFAYFNNIPDEKGFSYNYGNEEPYIAAPLPDQERQLTALDARLAQAQRAFDALQRRLTRAQLRWERRPDSLPDWTVTRDLNFRDAAQHDFDGATRIELKQQPAAFGYLEPFTFSAWVKPATTRGGIFSQQEDYLEGTGHALYVMDGKLRLHIVHRWTDLALRVEASTPLEQNTWQHVLVTYDGKRKASGVRIYVNGELQKLNVLFDQLNEPFKVSKEIPFRIGSAGGLRFTGSIADVRVYKAALDPREAAAVAAREPVSAIARKPRARRTAPERAKLALAFLDQSAPLDIQSAHKALEAARLERNRFADSIPTVMVMLEAPTQRDTFLLKRGAYDAPGDPVTPGVPEILPQLAAGTPPNRLGLARWLVDRANPLTARVAVNRFWQSFFGTGIVKTVDDFGSQGEWPVHPELLDWLATEFMDNGWNIQAIQKLMVMSATYRQSSRLTPELLERDPANRLLARGPRFRLGPEVIRDSALLAAGLLVEKQGGPSVKPYQPQGLWQELAGGSGYVQDKGEGLYRRSLYTYWKRTVAPPFMVNFDSPNREVCTVYEGRTNTPLQALDLMNDVLFHEAARKMAERMILEGGSSEPERIAYGYQLLLARDPRPAERTVLLRTLADFREKFRRSPQSARDYLSLGDSPVRAGLDPVELAAYSTVASLVLNLDATVTKE